MAESGDPPPGPAAPRPNPCKGATGLRRIANATRNSLAGLASAWRCEAAFRQEVLAACLLIPLALLLDVPALGKAAMIASVLLVLVVELINSAIEATVDRISLERHELAGRAKDLGSAAVMLALVLAATVWAFVLFG